MEEKKKKQIIMGSSAAGAVVMGAGAALLMPGQTGDSPSDELSAEVANEDSGKATEENAEVLVAEVEEQQPAGQQEPLLAQNNQPAQNAQPSQGAQSAQPAQPIQSDHPVQSDNSVNNVNDDNNVHNVHPVHNDNNVHNVNNDNPAHPSHLAQNTPAQQQEVADELHQDALEPEGLSDQILALNVNTEELMPENDSEPEIQIINTPDDMQYFVVDVNSDGMYDTILDETGMEVENIPDGALMADADGFGVDNDIFISTEDDIQVIGHAPAEDVAVINVEDDEQLEALAAEPVNDEQSEALAAEPANDEQPEEPAAPEVAVVPEENMSDPTDTLDISEQPDFADYSDIAMQ